MTQPCPGWEFPEETSTAWDAVDPDIQIEARMMAGATMRSLTAYLYGGCPMVGRPCARRCLPNLSVEWLQGAPYMGPGNVWLNTCGCRQDCSCVPESRVDLTLAGEVHSVTIDGQVLPSSAYRLEEGRWLIRLDGGVWPDCQDMLADSGPGTFLVEYLPGWPVGILGQRAGQALAEEFGKLLTGDKSCQLPSNLKSVNRQGLQYELVPNLFENGKTGVRATDSWVAVVNPNHLRFVPSVWSPDSRRKMRGIGV